MDQPPGAPPPPPPTGGPDWEDMKGRITGARGPDRTILVAGTLFFIATFLPWYRVRVAGVGTASSSAWGVGGLGVLAALLGTGLLALTVAVALGAARGVPPTLTLILAGATLLFTLLRFVIRPEGSRSVEVLTGGAVSITRGFGLWAALALAIVMTVAAAGKARAAA